MELLWSKIWVENSLASPMTTDEPDYSEQYAMITSPASASPQDILKFDHKRGVALCIGIDIQFNRVYENKSLGSIVAKNAEDMGKALVTNFGLSEECVKVCSPSAQPDQCSRAGICSLFMETARKAEQNSIFIFYFAGHGYSIDRKCVLAPSDFVGTNKPNSGISGNDLVKWLHKAQCQASYSLFIFDCCYAGDLGISLTSSSNIQATTPHIFVMCGCAPRERCTSIYALGHSVFTFFLLHYLAQHSCKGQFVIQEAMEEIIDLCFSFSSLIVTYNRKKDRLLFGRMNPSLYTVCSIHKTDSTDSNRYPLLYSLYKHGPKPLPHPEINRWLKSQRVEFALLKLPSSVKSHLYGERLNDGIFCAMLYSAASMQVAHDKIHLKERNFFITIALNVLETACSIFSKTEVSILQLIRGLWHYLQPLKEAAIDVQFLEKLLSELYDMASESYP